MSGTPALTYEIKRNGKLPQIVTVQYQEEVHEFQFGCYVPEKKIIEQLPRLLLDFRRKRRSA